LDEFDGDAVGVTKIDDFTAGIRSRIGDIRGRYRTDPIFFRRRDSGLDVVHIERQVGETNVTGA
jgi:hypothetical protein